MTKQQTHILRAAGWLFVVLSIFAWTADSYHSQKSATLQLEIILRHAIVMQVLCMPFGLILTIFLGTLLDLLGLHLTGLNDALFITLACGIGGYIQWFVVLPAVIAVLGKRGQSVQKAFAEQPPSDPRL